MAQFTFIPQLQQNQQPNIVDTLAALGGAYAQKRQKTQQRMDILEALKQRGFSPEQSQALSALPESILRDLFKSGPPQQKNEEQLALLKNIFQQRGIDPSVADIENPAIQKLFIQEALRPESLGQVIGRYAERLLPGQSSNNSASQIVYNDKNEPLGVKINNTLIPVNNLSPETINNLRTLNEPKQAENQSSLTTALQKLGQFGTGALTSFAGIPGDVLQLGSNIAGGLGSAIPAPVSNIASKLGLTSNFTPEERQNSIKHWQDKLKKLNPNTNEYTQAQEILQNLQEGDQPVQFPTGDVLKREIINPAVKGTPAEKFVTPQDDLDEFLQEIGGTTALLTNPTSNVPTLLKNALKAGGIAVGGDILGWMTKNATGSDKLGNAVKNGTYLMYNLFPGLAGRLGQKSYNAFNKQVIEPAMTDGKLVDMGNYRDKFSEINKKINNNFVSDSEPAKFLKNESKNIKGLMGQSHKNIDTKQLIDNMERMDSIANSVPPAAKPIFDKINNIQKRIIIDADKKNKKVKNVSDTIKAYSESLNNINKKIPKEITNNPELSKFINNEINTLESILGTSSKINPEALWNNIKTMGKYYDKVPDQAKGVFGELIGLQQKALGDFSNTITPNGAKLLENANDFWRTSHLIQDDLDFVKKVSNPRNFGTGAFFFLTGGFPLVLKAAIGTAGTRFSSRMIQSPAVRETMTQLAKASSAQNASLVNKMITRLDRETESILNKMSPEDQKKIRSALSQAQLK